MDQQTMFLKTPPARLFFMAALPGAVGMLASALYQLADGILVGHFLDSTSFAAPQPGHALCHHQLFPGRPDRRGVLGAHLHLAGAGQGQTGQQLFHLRLPDDLHRRRAGGGGPLRRCPRPDRPDGRGRRFAQLAVQYLRVYAVCSPVTTIVFATDNYLRICGQVRGSMCLNIFMSALSAGLEFLFLAVFGWGIWAAALGTCTGMMVCAVIALTPFARGKLKLHFCRPRFSRDLVARIVRSGLPNFLNNVAGRITSILMNVLLVQLGGETAVSVYGVLMYADGFVQPLLYGTCDSLQPAVGYNWGAGRFGRSRAIEFCCLRAALLLCGAALAVMALFPGPIAGLFLAGSGAEAMAMATGAVRLFSLTYLARWFSFWAQSYLLAVEKALQATIISISTALIFPVLLIGVLWPLGLTGLWLNFAGTAVLAGILAAVLLRREWPELSRPDRTGPAADT